MSTLKFLDLSTNKLSGSFATSFGARSQLIFLAISGNVGLVRHLHNDFFLELAAPQDWDLSVFDLCSSITYLLMQVLLMPQVLPNHVVVHRTVALVALYHRCYPGPLNSTRYSWLLPLHNPFCLSLHNIHFCRAATSYLGHFLRAYYRIHLHYKPSPFRITG